MGKAELKSTRRLCSRGNADEIYPVPTEKDFEQDGTEYLLAPDLAEIGEGVISVQGGFGYLAEYKLVYLWKAKGGSSHGKAVLGRCQRPKGLLARFCDADFIISLSADHCHALRATRWHVEAIIFHELCHTNEEEGEPRLVPHDYEGFCREIELYGTWKPDLERAARAFQQLKLL